MFLNQILCNNAHYSDCSQKILYKFNIQYIVKLQTFIFCTLGTNGLITNYILFYNTDSLYRIFEYIMTIKNCNFSWDWRYKLFMLNDLDSLPNRECMSSINDTEVKRNRFLIFGDIKDNETATLHPINISALHTTTLSVPFAVLALDGQGGKVSRSIVHSVHCTLCVQG